MVKNDIYKACLFFFDSCSTMRAINCTVITLVPKVINPTFVKDCRPICYANVVYKIIAKVLSRRIHKVSPSMVDMSQSGFIPRRQILHKVLLGSELIKGYGSKHHSPRCMIKMDLGKAYDFVEWTFVRGIMATLGFPLVLVEWIMEYISSVSYSVWINSKPQLLLMPRRV